MKETKKCSLSGLAFTMDEDAYRTLKEYLESLKRSYADTPDGGEIIADIEARIAELILSTQDNTRVVERPLVMNIIAQLGTAEDIREESAPMEEDTSKTVNGEPRIPRRLYRDMENARLGGVCAGLAKYFSVEISWVRLGFCAPMLFICLGWTIPFMHWIARLGSSLFGVAILSYLVMWIAVPAARTARQKLEANGEKITVKSIREASADKGSSDTDRIARPVVAETVTVIGRIVILLLKLFAMLIVFGLTMFAIILIIGFFVLMFAGKELFGSMGTAGEIITLFDSENLLAVMGVIAVLIPVLILIYVLVSLLIGSKLKRWALLVMFILWIATIIALPVTAIKMHSNHIHVGYTYSNSDDEEEHDRLQDSIDREAARYVLPQADTIIIEQTAPEGLQSIDLD